MLVAAAAAAAAAVGGVVVAAGAAAAAAAAAAVAAAAAAAAVESWGDSCCRFDYGNSGGGSLRQIGTGVAVSLESRAARPTHNRSCGAGAAHELHVQMHNSFSWGTTRQT